MGSFARQAPRDDLRDTVAAHCHAVEDIGGLHRLLLVGDDDELGPVGVAAQELDEAADVGVVQRRLDLIEEVERARPGEEQSEEERDRAECLLAAGEERQARDALPDRAQFDLDAVFCLCLRPVFTWLGKPQPPVTAGEERRGDLLEVRADRRESLVEAALDRLGELGAQLLELLQARLEILALLGQLGEALLLAVVLLLGERVDLA